MSSTRRRARPWLITVAVSLLASLPASAPPANASHQAGPLVLMGIDAEDGGPGGHGPVANYVQLVDSMLDKVRNGADGGILVVGGGKNAGDHVTAFWNAVAAGADAVAGDGTAGEPVTHVNGAAAIAAQSLAGYEIVAVASSYAETASGGLTGAENDALADRANDVARFVNAGGGVVGLEQSAFANPFAYVAGLGTFSVTNVSYSDIDPTTEGTAVGVTNALDVCCWHQVFTAYPSYLDVLAHQAGTAQAAAVGGDVASLPGVHPPIPDGQTIGACHRPRFGGFVLGFSFSSCRSDPVNTATGAFEEAVVDIALPGVGLPFVLARSYSSADATVGPLGRGWTHSLAAALTVAGDGDVTVRAGDGQQLEFDRQADGSFVGGPGVHATLASVTGGGYDLVRPDQVRARFDAGGRLLSQLDRNGKGLTLAYGGDGRLATVSDSAGRVVAFTHDADGRLTRVQLPDGRAVTYAYTAGLLTSATDLAGATTTYAYDGGGRLAAITDANGHQPVRNTYGPDGRVSEQFDALGNHSTFAWDPETGVATMTDAQGRVWTDVYAGNLLFQAIDPLANTVTYLYDDNAHLASVSDAAEHTTQVVFDAAGNLTARTAPEPLAYTEAFTYDAVNNLRSAVDGRGNTTTFDYDAAGNLTTITRPGNTVTTFVYDPTTAQLTATTDARGKTTTFGYDTAGNLTSVTSPLGNRTTFSYDGAGRRLSTVEPRGNVAGADPAAYRTTWTYDGADRLLTETDPAGHVTAYGYDPVGNTLTVTDAAGGVTTLAYNPADEVVSVTDAAGAARRFSYDSRGDLVAEESALGHTTTYGYDAARRLTSVVTPRGNAAGADPAAFRWTYGYDANSNRTSVTNPLGQTTSYAFDALDRLSRVTDALAHATIVAYDANANRTSVTNPAGETTTYGYDALDRLTSLTDPRAKTTTYAYDPVGNLMAETTPLGHTTTWTYDDDGRLATMVEARGNAPGADPAAFRWTYGYDPAGHQVAETDPLGQASTWSYDRHGLVSTVGDANAHTTAYGYDALHRLVSVTAPDGGVTAYAYDPAGNLITRTDANGHLTTYGYDADRRLTSVVRPGARRWAYAYDPAGNRTEVTDANGHATAAGGDGVTTYAYDAAERLVGVDYADAATPDVTYAYDAAGRRTSMVDGAGTETYGYDPADRLAAVTRGGAGFAYAYDPAGNLTRRTYPDGTVVDLGHDDDGRLASVTTGGRTTTYTWDPAANLVATAQPNGVAESRTWDRAGRLTGVRATRGTSTLFAADYVLDPVGNPRSETRTGPAPAATYRTERASVTTSGAAVNGTSQSASISADGRYVAFASDAPDLVAGDTNGVSDVFVRDRAEGTTVRVSVSSQGGSQANGASVAPSMSADGRFVAFASDATNLVWDPNGQRDIFIRDLKTGVTTRVWGQATGAQPNAPSEDPAISADGRFVAFASDATNLVADDGNGRDVFVYDRANGTLESVSANARISVGGVELLNGGPADQPAVSADGRFVAFRARELPHQANPLSQIVLYDRTNRAGTVVSTGVDGITPGLGNSTQPSLSGDGTRVAFDSDAADLALVDTNLARDVFVHDTTTNQTRQLSTTSSGDEANGPSSGPSISADGTRVAFASLATNLLANNFGQSDTNGVEDVFVRNVEPISGDYFFYTTRVSVDSSRAQANGPSYGAALSANGLMTAFTSGATNLAPGEGNLLPDVFVHEAPGWGALPTTTTATTTYRYDAADRLVEACFTAGCSGSLPNDFVRYQYDKVGNRTIEERPGGYTAYTYNDRDELVMEVLFDAIRDFTYDANGNQTGADGRSFAYDQANRMVSATDATGTTAYAYDGDGKRLGATTGTAVTKYLWDVNAPLAQLVGEQEGAGTTLRRYIHGAGLVSMSGAGAEHYYHQDPLGSVMGLSSSVGTAERSYAYEPFGGDRGQVVATTGAPASPLRYTGQLADASGLYHLRARQYDPGTGRFTARDPLAPSLADPYVSSYVYANDRPTVTTDPSGLRSETHGEPAALGAGRCPSILASIVHGKRFSDLPENVRAELRTLCEMNRTTTTLACMESNRRGHGWRGASTGFGTSLGDGPIILVPGLQRTSFGSNDSVAWCMQTTRQAAAEDKGPGGKKRRPDKEDGEDDDAVAADEGPKTPTPDEINAGNLKNVDPRRVQRETGLNPEEIKREYLGERAPIARYDLKRDPSSGRLVIVEKQSQRVIEVTDYDMGSR